MIKRKFYPIENLKIQKHYVFLDALDMGSLIYDLIYMNMEIAYIVL